MSITGSTVPRTLKREDARTFQGSERDIMFLSMVADRERCHALSAIVVALDHPLGGAELFLPDQGFDVLLAMFFRHVTAQPGDHVLDGAEDMAQVRGVLVICAPCCVVGGVFTGFSPYGPMGTVPIGRGL
ncbi:hypothetical protein [Pigmentiphaga soli]|uniref:hypothetical protein n=1 Tax=Pigmentiphaga soli TaxID=1007095 RepID=UPI0031EC0872